MSLFFVLTSSIFVTEAPVYLSYPHFYKADPKLLAAVEGLSPKKEKHETFFKIQPVSVCESLLKTPKYRFNTGLNLFLQKLGVTLEASVKVQLNLKVERQTSIRAVAKFPSIMFPIIWAEEVKLTPQY